MRISSALARSFPILRGADIRHPTPPSRSISVCWTRSGAAEAWSSRETPTDTTTALLSMPRSDIQSACVESRLRMIASRAPICAHGTVLVSAAYGFTFLSRTTVQTTDGASASMCFAFSSTRCVISGGTCSFGATGASSPSWRPLLGKSALRCPSSWITLQNSMRNLGHTDERFQTLLRLIGDGHCWAKLSGAYRCSKLYPDYPDVSPLYQELVKANPERLVWGSDWPHPQIPAAVMPNDGRLLNLLLSWITDPATLEKNSRQKPRASLWLQADTPRPAGETPR